MAAVYNEIEPYAAQWLRNLIAAGHIAPGDVDERSIRDVGRDDWRDYTQVHCFAGIGIWSLSLRMAGVGDDEAVWTGSCPCQPFSAAGKQRGMTDDRHLWPAWFDLIAVHRPGLIFGEQVASKDALDWFDLVSSDLEGEGYAVGAADLGVASVGAPHIRQRLWFVGALGHHHHQGLQKRQVDPEQSRPLRIEGAALGAAEPLRGFWAGADWIWCRDGKYRAVEPSTFPLAHGYPSRVGRLRAYGNAISPQVASAFIEAALECRP